MCLKRLAGPFQWPKNTTHAIEIDILIENSQLDEYECEINSVRRPAPAPGVCVECLGRMACVCVCGFVAIYWRGIDALLSPASV